LLHCMRPVPEGDRGDKTGDPVPEKYQNFSTLRN
jgi:hypothetical protein